MSNIEITVTQSCGSDGALLIFVDGKLPKGVRVVVNDETTYGTPPKDLNQEREAKSVSFKVSERDIGYL